MISRWWIVEIFHFSFIQCPGELISVIANKSLVNSDINNSHPLHRNNKLNEESHWESVWDSKYTSLLFHFTIRIFILLRLIGVSRRCLRDFSDVFECVECMSGLKHYTCTGLMTGSVIHQIDTTLMHFNIWINAQIYIFLLIYALCDLITRRWACWHLICRHIKLHTTNQSVKIRITRRYMKKDYLEIEEVLFIRLKMKNGMSKSWQHDTSKLTFHFSVVDNPTCSQCWITVEMKCW